MRKREFRSQTARPTQVKGGLRHAARATAQWVERQPVEVHTVKTPSGTYPHPGRGQNGESSN